MKGNVVVGQSGGPTAVINSSVAGVYAAAKKLGVNKVYGMVHGIEGFLQDKICDLDEYLADETGIELLKRTPSAFLGSCRFKMPKIEGHEDVYEKIFEIMEKHDIECLFYCGGNDSMDTVMKLDSYFKEKNTDIKVVGIPKTIDNDVMNTDHTPGFGSAAKYVAATIQEIIRDSRVYSVPSVTIVEIMGRDAGWLTASSCVLRANGEPAPHLIYLPESPFSTDKFLSDIREQQKRHKAVIAAVSEGIVCENRQTGFSSELTDVFGHKFLSGVGKYLENITAANIGCKVRSIELNVMQRCSAHIASLTDITEAEQIGAAAVNAAVNGESGVMMTFHRISNNPYRVEILSSDIRSIANMEKKFPCEWISKDGNDVTTDALNYFLPLISGEVYQEYKNGIPVHFRLDQ